MQRPHTESTTRARTLSRSTKRKASPQLASGEGTLPDAECSNVDDEEKSGYESLPDNEELTDDQNQGAALNEDDRNESDDEESDTEGDYLNLDDGTSILMYGE